MTVKKKQEKRKKKIQEEGKLMLDNPLIPPELDEDIDDDLAFDSEDERLYGNFFASNTSSKGKKGKKAARSVEENADDYYHEEGQSSDSDGYLDLSDMLDQNIKEEEEKASRRQPTIQSETGAKLTKKRRSAAESAQALMSESLFPDQEHHVAYNTVVKKMARSGDKASRLVRALDSTHNLISVDVEDKVKDAVTRKKVREVTEENMNKYKPVLRELNQAKHLQLPLRAPDSNPVPSSLGGIVASSVGKLPDDELQSRVLTPSAAAAHNLANKMQTLLRSAGLESSQTEAASEGGFVGVAQEGGAADDGSRPTIQYMAKLKAMLANENSRRKRLNKIKSKTYRRIMRKELERDREKREKALALLNPELARKRLAEKLAKARAEERITQKHKNTSAWVKHAKKYTQFDTQAKDAVNEQLALHQQLMRKMEDEAGEENYRRYVDDDDGAESEEEDRMVDELLTSNTAEATKNIASRLWNDIQSQNVTPAIARAREELKSMKFMKDGRERHVKQYMEELNALKEEARQLNGETAQTGENKALVPSQSGRKKFGATKEKVEEIILRSDEKSSRMKKGAAQGEAAEDMEEEMQTSDEPEVPPTEFAGARMAKARPALKSSSRITILPSDKSVSFKRKAEEEALHDDGDDGLGEHQEYLVSRAFAEDEVDDDFNREKESQVENMMRPEDRNSNLPGWGEWGGEDERLNKRHQEKREHALLQKKIEKTFLQKSRADAALEHVIINHDGVELVPDRMKLHMVPRPFSNPQEFARSMRQPMGPEWTSALSFVEGVQPRVEVKQGHSVAPLDLSLRRNTSKTKRRKVEK